jgi:hypothetical protein
MQRKDILIFVLFILIVTLACGQGNTVPLEASDGSDSEVTDTAESPTATAEPTPIVHVLIPDALPEKQSGVIGDQDSSITADDKRAPSGDRFTFGRYERPFNANTMDVYYPALDIQGALFYEDDTWLYAQIKFKNNDSSYVLNGKYGFEIDLDIDGGGDWLILVSEPSLEGWSTNGVEVWFDSNNDVGGVKTMYSDNTFTEGNGYETLVFGTSQGDDPDLAWGRISPQDPYAVEIAVKRSILEGDSSFMVGVWAGTDDLNPALFDFNDHYTHEQAGTSLIEFEYFYPIKELSELDNTCRMAIGFQPLGNEPGLCPLPPKPGQDPPASGCPAQYTVCFNFGNQVVCYCVQP